MNAFFAALGAKLSAAAGRPGADVEAPRLDPELAEELLALARAVAHSHERRFAPLATYMAGIAVERARLAWGADDRAQLDLVRRVREQVERDTGA